MNTRIPFYSVGVGVGISLLFVFFCVSNGMAQSSASSGGPPQIPGISEPPRLQGMTTTLPADLHLPDTFKEARAKAKQQLKDTGYLEVKESQALRLDLRESNIKQRKAANKPIKSMAMVAPTLGVHPADLRSSLLATAVLLETTESGGRYNDQWSGVNRLFRMTGLGLVELDEWDPTVDHGGIYFDPSAFNQNVNGYSAVLEVQKSLKGSGLTTLTWYNGTKVMTLTINRALNAPTKIQDFILLAESIQ